MSIAGKAYRAIFHTRLSGVLFFALLLLFWELFAVFIFNRPEIPPFSAVMVALVEVFPDEILPDIFTTLSRYFMGYTLAILIGISVGLAMGFSRKLHAILDPFVEFLRPLPSVAIIFAFIVILGIGNEMRMAIIAYACIWPILINTIDGVHNVDPVQISTARTFQLSRGQIIKKIYFPSATPFIVSGMRVSLAIALVIVIITEMLVCQDGIGCLLWNYSFTHHFPESYAALLSIAVLGYLLNFGFLKVEHRGMAWHVGYTRQEV